MRGDARPRSRCGPIVALTAALLGGCVVAPEIGLSEVLQRPAERALLAGLRAYEDGQYVDAERELNKALASGLVSAKDRASAHKHLAFVYCTSQRLKPCEDAFRAARAADPTFALTRAEAGHPLWGSIYRRVVSTP
jgi:Tfp pilus assembly protein PilF